MFSRGAYTLFSLSPGQHTLTWHAAPFAPQQCRISVPLGSGRDTCQFPVAAPDLGGTISATIRFPTNVTMLSARQRTALIQAAQAVLDRQQSSATVQAGEVYTQTSAVSGTNTRSCTVVLQRAAICFAAAQQPLEATLHLRLDTSTSPAAPCANGACDSDNQDCRLFCDVPAFAGSNIISSPTVWQVSVLVQLLWQFTTRDGQVVEENQADSFILGQQNALTVPLNITWNGMGWGVTPTSQSGSFGSDPVCQAAFGDMYTLVFASAPPNTEPQLVPGPTPASGCLISIPPGSSLHGTPMPIPPASMVASVIQRFGVLLAVNAMAHHLWPFLPVADASTQHMAQQLIT